MEIMGNSSRLNESDAQTASSNYSYRLSQDLNLGGGTNSRISKSERDIGLLVACKVQLSTEVIQWKTESLRLQKERDSVQQRNQDLDQTVAKLTDKTQDLEARLLQAEAENRQLKSRSLAIDEEKTALVNKLSQNFNKYHSFPWSDVSTKLTAPRTEQKKGPDILQDDWKEVSQKMLQQMKLEMKELQEMSSRFCSQGQGAATSESEEATGEELEVGISSLRSETKSLKYLLLQQRQKLQHLLNSLGSAEFQKGDANSKEALRNSDLSSMRVESSLSKNKPSCSKPNRLTDENYRHYFTKQLGTSCDLSKISKEMQQVLKNQETCCANNLSDSQQKFKSPISKTPQRQVTKEQRYLDGKDGRVCPICGLTFDVSIPQEEFEQHVVNHLETESASLLDQYVVI